MITTHLQLLKQTYSGKRIFLTGHTGFKGSWLTRICHWLGAEVRGYALPPENEFDLYHIIEGDKLCDSIMGDLRDRSGLAKAVSSFEPDFVFHLAAQPLVRLSYQIPSETFDVNAIGTANVLDAVKLLKAPCHVVLITTDKVYHNHEWAYPYRENDRLGGYDPYSASKACAEIIIDSYRNSFFPISEYNKHQKGIAVARAGNVIGGGDWAKDRLLPDIARALSKKEKVVIRNPESIRPWQHVLESLYGYLLLGAKLSLAPTRHSQAYNFGPLSEDALSVDAMVKMAIEKWGEGDYTKPQLQNQPHEAGLLKLDISKAWEELEWKPRWNAKQAIEATVAWYKTFHENQNQANDLVEKQINFFFQS